MDTSAVNVQLDKLASARDAKKNEEVIQILQKLQADVKPTEELLKVTKAGVKIAKFRSHEDAKVSKIAHQIVQAWKEAIGHGSGKRKRDEEGKESGDTKRVKAEGSSAGASPAVGSPDRKPKAEVKDEKTKPEVGAKSESPGPYTPTTIDSSRTTPRTAKSDAMADKLKAEGDSRDVDEDVRNKCVVLLYDGLANDSTAEKRIIAQRAVAIERATFQQQVPTVEVGAIAPTNQYRAKIRSLFLNIKEKGNAILRDRLVTGALSAEDLVNMSKEEMASDKIRQINQKLASDNLFKAKAVGETQAETDAFKCGRCQQKKCTYYQMQTRSADEPMTTFVTCTNCGNRWKFS